MRTLKVRIVVIFGLTLIGSSLAMLWISASVSHRFTVEFFEGSIKLELPQAQRVYEAGGPERLAQYLAETDAALGGTRYLTDANGRDLISGVDHSKKLPTGFDYVEYEPRRRSPLSSLKPVRFSQTRDQRVRLLSDPVPRGTNA
jgi:hypothetical protein